MSVPSGRPIAIVIDEATNVGEARRRASGLAAAPGFDETGQGKVALVQFQ